MVTGGTGFLGKNLSLHMKDWVYLSSKDCDLTDYRDVMSAFQAYNPDAIVHLAARVGGIKDNVEHQADFCHLNNLMNINVLKVANDLNINRVLSCLSTCAFPDVLDKYPFTEDNLFDGKPAISNLSYGMTKRMLKVSSDSYRAQYGRNYSTFCPSNLYGPFDSFDDVNSHFVPAMISRMDRAKEDSTVEFWGTGRPLRQQEHNTDIPLIVAPDQNLSIKETVEIFLKILKKQLKIKYNGKLDGQYRKDGSNEKLKKLINNFQFTKIEKGLKDTYEWYKNENSTR